MDHLSKISRWSNRATRKLVDRTLTRGRSSLRAAHAAGSFARGMTQSLVDRTFTRVGLVATTSGAEDLLRSLSVRRAHTATSNVWEQIPCPFAREAAGQPDL